LGGILIGCLLLGLNYIYYAFFGCLLIGAAALVGYGRTRSRSVLRAGGLCIGVIVLATALNMVPNVLVWRDVGHPRGIAHNASESETYALKIRTLVSPVWTFHWFPPFRTWLEREGQAMFPVETESVHTRLGIVGTVGLVALLATLVWPGRRQPDAAIESPPDDSARREAAANVIPAAARLTLVAILVATLGGFGSLFSLLVSPEIRSYNRIAPFIAFFVLAGGAAWLDRLFRPAPRPARLAAWVLILGIGLADQGVALYEVKRETPRIEPAFRRIAAFVSELETRLPPNAVVFQLPLRPFPVDGGIGKLWAYDQFRPYLLSHQLRWSYPSLTERQYEWEESIAALPTADLPRRLARDGFTAILISRAGYDDGGTAIVGALRAAPDGPSLIAESEDFFALRLSRSEVAP
jgi:phosphoglycerol transferase